MQCFMFQIASNTALDDSTRTNTFELTEGFFYVHVFWRMECSLLEHRYYYVAS